MDADTINLRSVAKHERDHCDRSELARIIEYAADEIERLREALNQLLDDMGDDGLCVCEAAKQQAKAAMAQSSIKAD